MLWMDTSEGNFLTNHGGVLLADNMTFPGLRKVIESQGYLCADLAPPGPAARGRLSLLIEEGIEVALEKVGAVAPGVGANANVDASISDQLYRARLVEKRGIVVMLPYLEGMSNWAGILDGEDSVTLSWWMQATQERPLGLVIESANQSLKVYPTPVPFESLLRSTTYPPPPPTAPEQASSTDAMDLSEPPPGVRTSELEAQAVEIPDHALPASAVQPELDALAELDAPLAPVDGEPCVQLDFPEPFFATCGTGEEPIATESATELRTEPEPTTSNSEELEAQDLLCISPVTAIATNVDDSESVHDARTVKLEPARDILEAARNGELDALTLTEQPKAAPAAEAAVPFLREAPELADAGSELGDEKPTDTEALEVPEPAAASSTLTPSSTLPRVTRTHKHRADAQQDDADTTDPFHRLAQREWPNWLRELESTRGPKPLAVVERTFVSAYTPLKEAWLRNIAGPKALAALKTFADSFEQSYSEAFDALRVRGKRPTMVLDIPEIAQRIGRLHGARSIQLVLVDAMRFDVGLRVQDRLRRLSHGQVSLAERLLLWSALPTTTETQIDLIGKGSSGLREPIAPQETPALVARGKNAATPRRIKAGNRELIKLDVIEANIAEPGKSEVGRLDELADSVAEVMVDYLLKQPPRTLVMLFGDHGFLLDPVASGTSAGRSGGASPEEVLVPAFAWLVGNVH
jgi:hypothetical protein